MITTTYHTGLPLAWCIRDNETVTADPQDGWATVEDEMINRAPMRVNNALTTEFKENNQKVWGVLNSLTNGLNCRTIRPAASPRLPTSCWTTEASSASNNAGSRPRITRKILCRLEKMSSLKRTGQSPMENLVIRVCTDTDTSKVHTPVQHVACKANVIKAHLYSSFHRTHFQST